MPTLRRKISNKESNFIPKNKTGGKKPNLSQKLTEKRTEQWSEQEERQKLNWDRRTIERINEIQRWCFAKTNRQLFGKTKREDLNKFRNERGNITFTKEIQRIRRDNNGQWYAN